MGRQKRRAHSSQAAAVASGPRMIGGGGGGGGGERREREEETRQGVGNRCEFALISTPASQSTTIRQVKERAPSSCTLESRQPHSRREKTEKKSAHRAARCRTPRSKEDTRKKAMRGRGEGGGRGGGGGNREGRRGVGVCK